MHPSSTSCDYSDAAIRRIFVAILRRFGWLGPVQNPGRNDTGPGTEQTTQARTTVSGTGEVGRVQPAQRPTIAQNGAFLNQTPQAHEMGHPALAGVLNPFEHAAQQIGPSEAVRQERTRCLVGGIVASPNPVRPPRPKRVADLCSRAVIARNLRPKYDPGAEIGKRPVHPVSTSATSRAIHPSAKPFAPMTISGAIAG